MAKMRLSRFEVKVRVFGKRMMSLLLAKRTQSTVKLMSRSRKDQAEQREPTRQVQ